MVAASWLVCGLLACGLLAYGVSEVLPEPAVALGVLLPLAG
jgi:hypothetical protein